MVKIKMTSKESQIQKSILDWLALQQNCFAWRSSNHAVWDIKRGLFRKKASYEKGMPDIMGLKLKKFTGKFIGAFFCFEVKSPGGHIRNEQREWLARASDRGAYCWVVDSLDDAIKCWDEI